MSEKDSRTDAQLLADSGHDAEAFGVFYDRHVRAMLGYFYRRTLCAEMAADLTSETFAAAFIQRKRYRDTGAPARAWLVGIGRRQLANAMRRQAVETRARDRLGMQPVALGEDDLARIEELVDLEPMFAALRDALQELSPALSQALILRVGQDLTYAEVAERLGCSVGAARVRVARGLAALESRLEIAAP
ncbi:MAG: RNA polymerase sigma factor [Tetrasphaera sp.]